MALLARRQLVCGARRALAPAAPRSALPFAARKFGQRGAAVAAIEEQETSFAAPAAHSPSGDVGGKDYRIEELDAAQEELLSWMLFWDGAAQEKDLDEMQDYEELSDAVAFDEPFEQEVEELLETASETNLRPGQKVLGTVYEVDEDGAYVEIGAKSAGFVPLAECSLARLKSPLEVLRPGMQREFIVAEEEDEYGEIILSLAAIEAQTFWHRIKQMQEEDVPVYVTVTAATRGGLLVQYNHLEGFIPASHLGQNLNSENMEDYVGYELPAKFLEVDEDEERLVFSHRRASSDAEMQNFNVGDVVTGVVHSVKVYGAFLDIGGAMGLLHISQITHERLTTVEQVLQVGDKLKVMILSMDRDKGRVTLSTKKLEKTPGDMVRDPQLVFENAEAMAESFRQRIQNAEAGYMEDEVLPANQGADPAGEQQQYAAAVIRAAAGAHSASAEPRRVVDLQPRGEPPLRVHYVRRDQRYAGWNLHLWGDVEAATSWSAPKQPTGTGPEGPYWDIKLKPGAGHVGLLIHKGEEKAAGAEHVDPSQVREVWLVQAEQHAYWSQPDMSHIAAGTLFKSYAHWVKASTLVWRVPVSEDGELTSPQRVFKLHFSRDSRMTVSGQGVEGADAVIPLRIAGLNIPGDVLARYPHLYGATHLEIEQQHLPKVREFARGQVAVSVASHTGRVLECTGVQIAGMLDDLYATDAPLGDHVVDGDTKRRAVSVWVRAAAPPGQREGAGRADRAQRGAPALLGGAGGHMDVVPMTRNDKGVWTCPRPATWTNTAYKYRVTVFCPWTNKIETTEATDPYSRATTANGERSVFVDLDSPTLQPPGWWEHPVPGLHHWTDVSVYELHIRDFSATDPSVPHHLRGKYRAFARQHLYPGERGRLSNGLAHLKGLREAGLNHVHLLPTYDFGSVPERPEEQAHIHEDLSHHPPDSDYQQQRVLAVADHDAYNWGYDPVHYGVPEGSYSVSPDGPLRVLEFREMVQSLHALGLRVVLDVVYNHTYAAGPYSHHSVLDKIVPGYYHRRQEDGEMCHSTCCNNTASEHRMFERLMVEDLVHWVRTYKVDGFRFDIMGHHFITNLTAVRNALNALTPERDGVDGRHIYIYGEAWDFGEVALNQRGRNASQHNLGGSRIGAFNDRMRDGAMGGGPFSPLDTQGFATGLAVDPNGAHHQGSAQEQLATLLHRTDWVRFALAGNLKDFEAQVADGRLLAGQHDTYQANQPLAYGCDPAENVVFNGCHDNETIFDQVMMKLGPHVDADGRARVSGLCLALVLLSQGVPFMHAGDDLLRSKSLDRDSYNSGDWFNRIDWTGQDNNFGVGLPPSSKNGGAWPLKRPLLAQAGRLKPTPAMIARQSAYIRALLRVRYSSPLFRMPTAEHIKQQLRFHNTGPQQKPGVIVMQLHSSWQPDHGTWDQNFKQCLVVFNARPEPFEFEYPEGSNWFKLHPALAALQDDRMVQLCAADNDKRRLHVSPRLAAVAWVASGAEPARRGDGAQQRRRPGSSGGGGRAMTTVASPLLGESQGGMMAAWQGQNGVAALQCAAPQQQQQQRQSSQLPPPAPKQPQQQHQQQQQLLQQPQAPQQQQTRRPRPRAGRAVAAGGAAPPAAQREEQQAQPALLQTEGGAAPDELERQRPSPERQQREQALPQSQQPAPGQQAAAAPEQQLAAAPPGGGAPPHGWWREGGPVVWSAVDPLRLPLLLAYGAAAAAGGPCGSQQLLTVLASPAAARAVARSGGCMQSACWQQLRSVAAEEQEHRRKAELHAQQQALRGARRAGAPAGGAWPPGSACAASVLPPLLPRPPRKPRVWQPKASPDELNWSQSVLASMVARTGEQLARSEGKYSPPSPELCRAKVAVLVMTHGAGWPNHAAWERWQAVHPPGEVALMVHMKAGVEVAPDTPGAAAIARSRLATSINAGWGDISLVSAQLESMAEILARCPNVEHIALASGHDIPLQTLTPGLLLPGVSLFGSYQFPEREGRALKVAALEQLESDTGLAGAEAQEWARALTFHHQWMVLCRDHAAALVALATEISVIGRVIHRACNSVSAGMAPDEFILITALRAAGCVRAITRVEVRRGMDYPPGSLLNSYPTLVLFPAVTSPHPVTWTNTDEMVQCQVEKVHTGEQYFKLYSLRECLRTSVERCALFFRKVDIRDPEQQAALLGMLEELWAGRGRAASRAASAGGGAKGVAVGGKRARDFGHNPDPLARLRDAFVSAGSAFVGAGAGSPATSDGGLAGAAGAARAARASVEVSEQEEEEAEGAEEGPAEEEEADEDVVEAGARLGDSDDEWAPERRRRREAARAARAARAAPAPSARRRPPVAVQAAAALSATFARRWRRRWARHGTDAAALTDDVGLEAALADGGAAWAAAGSAAVGALQASTRRLGDSPGGVAVTTAFLQAWHRVIERCRAVSGAAEPDAALLARLASCAAELARALLGTARQDGFQRLALAQASAALLAPWLALTAGLPPPGGGALPALELAGALLQATAPCAGGGGGCEEEEEEEEEEEDGALEALARAALPPALRVAAALADQLASPPGRAAAPTLAGAPRACAERLLLAHVAAAVGLSLPQAQGFKAAIIAGQDALLALLPLGAPADAPAGALEAAAPNAEAGASGAAAGEPEAAAGVATQLCLTAAAPDALLLALIAALDLAPDLGVLHGFAALAPGLAVAAAPPAAEFRKSSEQPSAEEARATRVRRVLGHAVIARVAPAAAAVLRARNADAPEACRATAMQLLRLLDALKGGEYEAWEVDWPGGIGALHSWAAGAPVPGPPPDAERLAALLRGAVAAELAAAGALCGLVVTALKTRQARPDTPAWDTLAVARAALAALIITAPEPDGGGADAPRRPGQRMAWAAALGRALCVAGVGLAAVCTAEEAAAMDEMGKGSHQHARGRSMSVVQQGIGTLSPLLRAVAQWLATMLRCVRPPGERGAAGAEGARLRGAAEQIARWPHWAAVLRGEGAVLDETTWFDTRSREVRGPVAGLTCDCFRRGVGHLAAPAMALGAELGNAFPLSALAWCANPRCATLAGMSEAAPVARRRCSACRGARYCSEDCQRVHWRSGHKEACARVRAGADTPDAPDAPDASNKPAAAPAAAAATPRAAGGGRGRAGSRAPPPAPLPAAERGPTLGQRIQASLMQAMSGAGFALVPRMPRNEAEAAPYPTEELREAAMMFGVRGAARASRAALIVALAAHNGPGPSMAQAAAASACGAAAAAAAPLAALALPPGGAPTPAWCLQLQAALAAATWAGVPATAQVLPAAQLEGLVKAAAALLDKEPTLLELAPPPEQRVTVVGDTHGQFHDLVRLFELFGHPSAERAYVFNGDYVDRGAWGVETLALLLAWKVALPAHVFLLRGNHESATVTRVYGFYAELAAKYGKAAKGAFLHMRRMFALLPLAALVGGRTLVLHGGLFRAPPRPAKGKGAKRRRASGPQQLTVGTLDDLRKASKGGQDPDPERSAKSSVAADVVWSDPVNAPGLRPNDARGIGCVFGPDVTEAFLAASNGVRLIIRSHEGPDARDRRVEGDRMPSISGGWAVDHVGPSGRLATLFSAPDYPQFMAAGEARYNNRGAVAHLSAPGWDEAAIESFDAVLPRPHAESYYELPTWTEDEEDEQQHASEGSEGGEAAAAAGVPVAGDPACSALGADAGAEAAPELASAAASLAAASLAAASALREEQHSGSCSVDGGAPAAASGAAAAAEPAPPGPKLKAFTPTRPARGALCVAAAAAQQQPEASRRQLLQLGAALASSGLLPAAAQAAKAPRGFNPVQDLTDNYQFLYPFGWQEVSVGGADVVFKDVVEPLESVSVTITPTDKKDVTEFGDIADVANTLAKEVLTAPGQEVDVVSTNLREAGGHNYFEFEYTAKTPRYTRHSLAVVVANDGKFYTLTTGANEKRWGKMKDRLQTTIKSFSLVNA
ncbi:PU1 [Scenedesmus sp. PABB004]|nr:PU1 [Scenedesmus sp. PABB004]